MGKQNIPELVSFGNFLLKSRGVDSTVTAEDLQAWADQPAESEATETPVEINTAEGNEPQGQDQGGLAD